MTTGVDSWNLVTARSDQLMAALKDECTVAELIRADTTDLMHAAAGACARAAVLKELWISRFAEDESSDGARPPAPQRHVA